MAAPQGMVFRIDQYGNPQIEATLNTGNAAPWNDTPPSGDWVLTVTGAPASASQSAVQALLLANAQIGLPFSAEPSGSGPIRFQVSYASLNAGPVKLTAW